MRLARVLKFRWIEEERAANGNNAIVVAAKGVLERTGIAAFNRFRDHLAVLNPEDAESVILHTRPSAFCDPWHWIFLKAAGAFRLAVLAAITGDDASHVFSTEIPVTADVPVDSIDHHPVDTGIHPEADHLFNVLLKLVATPVVLRQAHRFTG